MTVSEWADARRYIPPEENPVEPGKWRTSRAEYQRGIMDAFSDPVIQEVVVFSSAGVGKTSILENVIGYHIDYDPCPILFVEPTDQDAKEWSKDHLAGMIRDTPTLREKVSDAGGRRDDNTIAHKRFPNGYIKVVGANSPRGFRRITTRIVLLDEVDGYPETAGPEGDPLELAKRRTRDIWNKKIGIFSTPTTKDFSRIEREWNQSDKRHFYLPCPRCKHFQIILFGPASQFASLAKGYLKIDRENPANSCYICEKCSSELHEADKFWMITRGVWRKTAPEIEKKAGFHLNELNSTFSSWEKVAEEWLTKKNRRESLRVLVNTVFGETWEEPDTLTTTEEQLRSRVEKYVNVPPGVCLLTCGVDVQRDRLEYVVKGWGQNEESWLIEYGRFTYTTPSGREAWQQMDDYLRMEFPVMDKNNIDTGVRLRIVRTFVDSGDNATQVYQWTGPRKSRGVFATKGMSGGERVPLIGKPTRPPQSRKNAKIVPIGVHVGKRLVYDRLDVKEKGPGYVHLNKFATDYYIATLVSEKLKTTYTRDHIPVRQWVPKQEGARNEGLDLEVLNVAAYVFLRPNMAILAQRLAEKIAMAQFMPQAESPAQVEQKAEPPIQARPRPKKPMRVKSNFISGGRWQ
jgi:phage terminase large subunit GpA-like protein